MHGEMQSQPFFDKLLHPHCKTDMETDAPKHGGKEKKMKCELKDDLKKGSREALNLRKGRRRLNAIRYAPSGFNTQRAKPSAREPPGRNCVTK
jgi:hypothetical protein